MSENSNKVEDVLKSLWSIFYSGRREFNDADKGISKNALLNIEKNWDEYKNMQYFDITPDLSEILRISSNDSDVVQRVFNLAQDLEGIKKLHVYESIAKYNPENKDISYKISEEVFSGNFLNSVNNYTVCSEEDDCKYKLFNSMVEGISNDEQFANVAFGAVVKTMQAHLDDLKSWDESDIERRKTCSQGSFFSYQPDGPAYDPRRFIAPLAAHNTESPELVERCLELSEHFPNYLQDIIYNRLLAAGYKANNFEDRYAQRLNNEKFDFQQYHVDTYNLSVPFRAVINIADKIDTKVLSDVARQANRVIDYENYEANKWHRDPDLSDSDYETADKLSKIMEDRIEQEKMASMDPLQRKMDALRKKIGSKLGKTDNYTKEEAKTHIDTAKQEMRMRHPKRGGMGE